SGLAIVFERQGKFSEAESLYQRSLAILEKALGSEHPTTAISLYNLAVFHSNRGKNSEARSLFERALRIQENALGQNHPDTVYTRQLLQGRFYILRCLDWDGSRS